MQVLRSFLLFLISLSLFIYVDCQCCSVNNPSSFSCSSSSTSCRCKFIYPNECINCASSITSYYSKDFNGVCSSSCLGDKIIDVTKECTSKELISSGSFYQLGDFYYSPSTSLPDAQCPESKICRCNKYFYIEYIYGKKKYHCFSQSSTGDFNSNYIYYNYKTNEFFKDECPIGFKVIFKNFMKIGSTFVHRCSDSCLDNEFYSAVDSSNGLQESCSKTCNRGNYTVNGITKCVDCESVNLYNKNGICVILDKCSFYSGSICYNSCNDVSGKNYHNFGSKECISDCNNGEYLYKDEDTSNKICYKKEQCKFIDEIDKKCYFTNCPSGNSFHNYDSNICISSCDSGYIYTIVGGTTCYPSCLTIPNGNYRYVSTSNFCTETECGVHYHIENDGVKRCLTQNECITKGYKYFIDNECRENCDGYYKLHDSTLTFTKCYETLEKMKQNSEIGYYDTNLKRCWVNEPTDFQFFVKKEEDISSTQKRFEIVEECEYFYYKNTNNLFYCIDLCNKVTVRAGGDFFFTGNKNCEASCSHFEKYFYDPSNNECLESCKGRKDYGFQNPTSDTPQKCLNSCNQSTTYKFYNFDSNICIEKCDALGNNRLYHTNGGNVCYPSCVDIPKKTDNGQNYLYELNNYICKTLSELASTECEYFYLQNNGIRKCVDAEICKSMNYIYLIEHTISGHTLKQCTNDCDDYYKLEDSSIAPFIKCFGTPNQCLGAISGTKIYYNAKLKKCWTNYQPDYFAKKIDSNLYELVEQCDYFYYISGGIPECINNCDSSHGGPFYNYDSNRCLSYCGADGSNKKYRKDGTSSSKACYSSCSEIPGSNYIYEMVDTDYPEVRVCSTTQPAGCSYYYLKNDEIRVCQTPSQCKDKNYNYIIGTECRDRCDGYIQKEKTDGSVSLIQCFTKVDDCSGSSSVIYYDKSLKKCWNSPQAEYGYINDTYTITGSSVTVYEIVKECAKFYKEVSGHFHCVDNCIDNGGLYFVSGQKSCKDTCNEFNKHFFNPTNNECLDTCKDLPNLKFANEIGSSNDPEECRNSCDPATYYNYGSYICLSYCGKDGSNYKYYKADGSSNICYTSCLDIPGGNFIYQTEDTTHHNYKCSDSSPGDCEYYYYRNDATKKCTDAADCASMNYRYLIGTSEKECKHKCDDYYKLEITITGVSGKFIKCFESSDECFNYINDPSGDTPVYYSERLKMCWTEYQDEYYIKNKQILPPKYELVETCEYYYYVDSDKKICTPACKSINSTLSLYFISGNKKCLIDCSSYSKKYYDPDNNECIDTCKGREKNKFQKPNTGTLSEPCLEVCPSTSSDNFPYYNFDSNVCLAACGGDKKLRANDGIVCYSSCADIPGGDYIYEKNNLCYKSISTGCEFYYIQNGAKFCVDKEECVNKQYKFFIKDENGIYECRATCEGCYKREVTEDIEIEGVTTPTDITYCYETLNKALLDTNVRYYNIKSKLCWQIYPRGYFIISSTSPQLEVVEECEYFYYETPIPSSGDSDHDPSSTNMKYYCINKCIDHPLDAYYFVTGQKKCEESCSKFDKYYYNVATNECLETCKSLPNFEFANKITTANPISQCKSQCDTNQYYDYDSNICISKCGENNPNYIYHPSDGIVCYPSCKDIQGGNYKYELKDSTETTTEINICYTSEPSPCPFYYMKKDGTLKCLDDCLTIEYKYLLGKECKNECNDYYKLDFDSNKIECFQTEDGCPTGSSEYKFYNKKLKKCWKEYPIEFYINDIDIATLKIEVVEECKNFYYKDVDNQYVCVEDCSLTPSSSSPYFVQGQKNCEPSCKAFIKYYYAQSNECLDTCIGKDGLEFADFIDFGSTSPAPEPTACKPECNPTSQHYNFGTKTCLSNFDCDGEYKLKKYPGTENICYQSCIQIPGGNHIYESGDICHSITEITDTNCPFYYSDNGVKKCITDTCKDNGFDYVYNKECLNNCENYYKLMDPSGTDTTIQCFETLIDISAKGIYFYDIAQKKGWINYPSDYYIKNENDGKYEVVQSCENVYQTKTDGRLYCESSCNIVNKYFFSVLQNCESSCTAFNKDYYNEINKECLDTCSVLENFKFSYPVQVDSSSGSSVRIPEKCINKCPNLYITKPGPIYECIDRCDTTTSPYKITDLKTKECLTACSNNLHSDDTVDQNYCYPECDVENDFLFIDIDEYNCHKDCPSYLPKKVPLGTFRGKEIFLCKSNCEENQFRLEDKCLEKCPEGFKYIGHNKICKEDCKTDPNGQHYYPINEDGLPTGDYLIYRCVNSCDEAIIDISTPPTEYLFYTETQPNECLQQCPNGAGASPFIPFYLSSKPHECLVKCPDNYPFYYIPTSNYECSEENPCPGTTPYFFEGDCFPNCLDVGKNYISSIKICMDRCPNNEIKQKNIDANGDHDGTYSCKTSCIENYFYKEYDDAEPECVWNCPKEFNYIGKDNICKQSCGEEDGLYYHKVVTITNADPAQSYIIYKCMYDCGENGSEYKYKQSNDNKECFKECEGDYPYLSVEENKCYDNCVSSSVNIFTLDMTDINGDIILRICSTGCINDGANKNIRYSTVNYFCKERCGEGERLVIEGRCESESQCEKYLNPLNPEEYECVDSCPNPNKYYYSLDRKCRTSCNNGDKVVEDTNMCIDNCNKLTNKEYFLYESGQTITYPYNKCVLECPNDKPYIDNGKCLDQCPEERRYFQNEFSHGEIEMHKRCSNDCPENYPYYKIRVDASKQFYECQAECDKYFVPNDDDSLKKATLCIDCPSGDYKYQIISEIDGKTLKKCYKGCPTIAKYHFDDVSIDNNCYEKCPELSPYYDRVNSICKKQEELIYVYILYDTKEWISSASIPSCPSEYKLYSKYDTITICLKNKCEYEYDDVKYFYKTPYDTCVKDCTTDSLVSGKHLKNDVTTQQCICENLYYLDDNTHQIVCYAGSIGKTCLEMKDTYPDTYPYPITLNGTNQCIKSCTDDRILNPSEDYCYNKNTPCSSIQEDTKLISKNGKKKCDCMYKYYYLGHRKICLKENDICPQDKSYYIPETMECIETCPEHLYEFKKACLDQCPSGTEKDEENKKCLCEDKFWYQISPGNFKCLVGECPDEFPVYINSTKQCLKTCKGTEFPYLFENKCYETCIPYLEPKNISSPLASFQCLCDSPWFYYMDTDNKRKIRCPIRETIARCEDYYEDSFGKDLKFMIKETKECVKSCPNEYPYYFNNKCYTTCEYANDKYLLNIEKVETSYECGCPNLWYIDPGDPYQDKVCYEKSINECEPWSDPSTRYQILSTKQCVESRDKCPPNSFKFNFLCYDQCPEFTTEGIDPEYSDKICKCNLNGFYYLDYIKYGNIYYECGLKACPKTFVNGEQEYLRKNLLEIESKCVDSCTNGANDVNNKYKFSFRDICIQECPALTKTDGDTCKFYDINDDEFVGDLNKLKDAANIQAKELYNKSEQLSGYLMNKFDASLQIYALNKLNNHRDLAMKSNLTYIDLGTCLDKIYDDHNLNDNDKILVTKYDLLTRTHKNNNNANANNGQTGDNNGNSAKGSIDDKYLINQVEYEFYLERTMEKIEGTICSPYEIQISYPIFSNKNKFNNYAGGYNDNNYLKQFEIGKQLHEKDPEIDTFNKDNKVYKDLCLGLELDGKDLVLEQRYEYLYPNNISLCESNCTMNNTDFDLQRINCMCSYKEEFDFNRKDEDNNDILNDPNFKKPTQSRANTEIMKCLSKIDVKNGIVNNEAFYYCGAAVIVEASMAVVSAIYGIKAIAGFLKGSVGKGAANSVVNMNGINKGVASTNRVLNNPPKKGDKEKEEEEEEENQKKNILVNKNIKMVYSRNSKNSNLSESSNANSANSNVNFGINTKLVLPKYNKRNIERFLYNKTIENNENNKNANRKAEFIPPQYNLKFFKPNDRGLVKKIERSKLPFKVNKDTKILLEIRKDKSYDEKYLEGPFFPEQNMIEIIDENNNKSIKLNDNANNNIVILKKNISNNNKALSIKEEKQKDFIKIKKINPIDNIQMTLENYRDEETKKVDSTSSVFTLMKREHTYLRATYEKYISKRHPNILAIILAEICDKIYFIKIFIFLKKFEILSIHLSLYMFYHVLLLTLICGFFTIKTIKKIWAESNFPTINFYLLYGLIANIIVWIIYKIFIVLLDNQDTIRSFVKFSNETTRKTPEKNEEKNSEVHSNEVKIYDIESNLDNENPQDLINRRYDEIVKKIKIQTIAFYIIILLLTGICFTYLVSFFAVYTGTKKLVLKCYYISIIEIALIKFVYGLCLASLRKAGEEKEFRGLYIFVYMCDKYLS